MKRLRTNGITVFITEDSPPDEQVIRIEEDNPADPDNPIGVEITLEQESLIRDFILEAGTELRKRRATAAKRRKEREPA